MSPGVTWGDSGEAQLHVLMNDWYVHGVIVRAHVLYFAIARVLFFVFPIDAVAAANVTAALFGAVTVANVSWLLSTFCSRRIAVLCGVALLAFSHTLWQLSSAAEVVTLSTALLTAELAFLVKLMETRRLRWLGLLLFANGLGVSNHNFALLMWPVYIVVAARFWRSWSENRLRAACVGLVCLLLGMVPVLLLCVDDYLARGSLSGTMHSFLAGHYLRQVRNVSDLLHLALRSILMAILNFPTPLLLFVVVGPMALRRRVHRGVFWFLGLSGLVYLLFGFRYNVPDQHVFLVPAFVFVAIFIGAGIDSFLSKSRPAGLRAVLCLLALLGPIVYAAAPPVLRSNAPTLLPLPTREVLHRDRFNWFIRPWRAGDDGPERFARESFELLPQDAWFFVDGTLLPPLNYLQVVEGLRKDVRLDNPHARQDWLERVGLEGDKIREAALQQGLAFSSTDQYRNLLPWLRERERRQGGLIYEPVGHIFHVARARGDE
ncbi:MAG: DUF2723 domain-containing protein [Phycisphaerales bacterium]|nr:MAG: DUF2723 domain-containing protein [Phycisphaerales bacterium]